MPGRIKHIPLPVLRAMAILARPFSPMFARQAGAAVVMNTTDMTFDASLRDRFPSVPSTSLRDYLDDRARELSALSRAFPETRNANRT